MIEVIKVFLNPINELRKSAKEFSELNPLGAVEHYGKAVPGLLAINKTAPLIAKSVGGIVTRVAPAYGKALVNAGLVQKTAGAIQATTSWLLKPAVATGKITTKYLATAGKRGVAAIAHKIPSSVVSKVASVGSRVVQSPITKVVGPAAVIATVIAGTNEIAKSDHRGRLLNLPDIISLTKDFNNPENKSLRDLTTRNKELILRVMDYNPKEKSLGQMLIDGPGIIATATTLALTNLDKNRNEKISSQNAVNEIDPLGTRRAIMNSSFKRLG